MFRWFVGITVVTFLSSFLELSSTCLLGKLVLHCPRDYVANTPKHDATRFSLQVLHRWNSMFGLLICCIASDNHCSASGELLVKENFIFFQIGEVKVPGVAKLDDNYPTMRGNGLQLVGMRSNTVLSIFV